MGGFDEFKCLPCDSECTLGGFGESSNSQLFILGQLRGSMYRMDNNHCLVRVHLSALFQADVPYGGFGDLSEKIQMGGIAPPSPLQDVPYGGFGEGSNSQLSSYGGFGGGGQYINNRCSPLHLISEQAHSSSVWGVSKPYDFTFQSAEHLVRVQIVSSLQQMYRMAGLVRVQIVSFSITVWRVC